MNPSDIFTTVRRHLDEIRDGKTYGDWGDEGWHPPTCINVYLPLDVYRDHFENRDDGTQLLGGLHSALEDWRSSQTGVFARLRGKAKVLNWRRELGEPHVALLPLRELKERLLVDVSWVRKPTRQTEPLAGESTRAMVQGLQMAPARPVSPGVVTFEQPPATLWYAYPPQFGKSRTWDQVRLRQGVTRVGRGGEGYTTLELVLPKAPVEVSHHHLDVTWEAGKGYQVLDRHSTNGTWLNGVRLEPGVTVPLASGTTLHLGADPQGLLLRFVQNG